MIRSLYTGLSGIIGSQYGMDVTGNNIAGINTLSFKYSRPTFRTIFEQNLYSGSFGNRVGLGSMLSSADRVMSVGNIEHTENKTDMAIGGNGFFLMRGLFQRRTLAGDVEIQEKDFLSRVGDFRLDNHYNFVQGNSGLIAMGLLAEIQDGDIRITKDLPTEEEMVNAEDKSEFLRMLQPINFKDLVVMPPKETSEVLLGGFLNSATGLDPVYFHIPAGSSPEDGEYTVQITFERKVAKTADDHELIHKMDDLLTDPNKVYKLKTDLINWPGKDLPDDPTPKPAFSGGEGLLVVSPDGSVFRSFFPDLHDSLEITIQGETHPLNIKEVIEERPYQVPSATTHISVFDSLGKEHNLRVRYEKIQENQWLYRFESASVDPAKPEFLIAYEDSEGNRFSTFSSDPEHRILGGILEFDDTGRLSDQKILMHDGSVQAVQLNTAVLFEGEESAFSININFDDHERQIIQTATAENLFTQQLSGRTTGSLLSLSANTNGLVYGIYSNRENVALARLPIISIRASQNLPDASRYGYPNAYEINTDPTQPDFIGLFRAGEGGTGAIISSALELSNVDISREMTNMIKFQRALQLNARSITTADTILEETIRLKR